jgi:hypothetical protein
MSDCCNAAVKRFVCGCLCCRRRFTTTPFSPEQARALTVARWAGVLWGPGCRRMPVSPDPEVAMFQDEPVSAEAQQRHFGQVLGAAIGQPGLSAPGHSSLIAVDNRRAEPALGRLFFREHAIALQSARTRPKPKPRHSPGEARGCTVRRAQAVRGGGRPQNVQLGITLRWQSAHRSSSFHSEPLAANCCQRQPVAA